MVHFAVIAPPLRGHYAPLSVLAEALIERGHQATFIHQEEARALVDARGASFAPIGAGQPPLDRWTHPMARIRHAIDIGGTMRRMKAMTSMFCVEGPDLMRRIGVDAVIADQLEPGGGLVADHLGLPFVTVATALPMNREPGVPPPFVDWSYDPSPRGLRRNSAGWRVSDFLLRGVNSNIAGNARRLGLEQRASIQDCFSPLLQLAQISAALDFPRRELPSTFHYAGPLRRRKAPNEFPLSPSDGRPTAFASLGTLQGARKGLFARIAKACDRAGVRLIIATGGADPTSLGSLPGDPLIFDWVPQDALLAQVDLVIGHGGMNTTLDALLHGLPMLLIALAFEQPGTAARVVHSGAGLMLDRRRGTTAFARAIRRLLDEPSFALAAMQQERELESAGGVKRAADLIERALGLPALSAIATRARRATDDVRDDSQSESS